MINEINYDGVEQMPLHKFSENAYLNYSMYVIMDRALPFIGDGLKPVQRRIIYAMSELGLNANAKYKKSARTVGDVLGKFHPHGDSACYEAMVLMAQQFSYRYPLIDGQGNWGAPDDPKSFAAMRYTESKLAKIAELLLSELDQGTADFQPNFDGTLEEPKYLPARLPHILLNGTTGIAVGMATDIPSHNINEVSAALIMLLDNPQTSIEQLLSVIKAPDYPTKAEIISAQEDLDKIYLHGKGSVRMRAIWKKESNTIIITDLPHQTSGSKVIEQIANQMRNKKLPMLEDIRDESDHEHATRIVLVARSNRIDFDALMSHLFATTDLEKSYRVNMNMIGLDGKPAVKNIHTILTEWLAFRQQTVTRRLQYRLDKILARLHILDGLLIAYLNIDEIISIIRNEDEPKQILIQRFGLTTIQADAILDLKLRNLAKLEEISIQTEQQKLADERDSLQTILASDKKLKALIKKEIQQDSKTFASERRSPIVQREDAKALSETDITPVEPVTIILSQMGWVRCAKGHDIDINAINYKTGDGYKDHAYGRSNQVAIFLDSRGRSYAVEPNTLPSARTLGEPLSARFNLEPNTTLEYVGMGKENENVLLSSDAGYGFICQHNDLISRVKNGKSIINLPENAKLLTPIIIRDDSMLLVAISSTGRMGIFPVKDLPTLAKGKGNQILSISSANAKQGKDLLVKLLLIKDNSGLVFQCGKRKVTIKADEVKKYYVNRGHKGYMLPRGLQNQLDITVIEPKADKV